MTLTSSRDQRDIRREAPHVGEKTDEADDRLELAQFEDAAARDKHFRILAVHRYRVHDPRAVPAVMAFLCGLFAGYLDEVAFREQIAPSNRLSSSHKLTSNGTGAGLPRFRFASVRLLNFAMAYETSLKFATHRGLKQLGNGAPVFVLAFISLNGPDHFLLEAPGNRSKEPN